MSHLLQANYSERQEKEEDVCFKSFTIPSTIHHHPQHHQVSQTIFLCVKDHSTSGDDDNMNIEVIDVSDADEEEEDDENASQNGSLICPDDTKVEVIELSDDGEDEVNDWTLDNHECSESSQNCNEMPLDLTYKTVQPTEVLQQRRTSLDPTAPTTNLTCQKQQKPLLCANEEKVSTNVSRVRVLMVNKHFKEVHKQSQQNVICLFRCHYKSCQFMSKSQFYLTHHQLTHTKLRPFWCTWPDCAYTARFRASVLQHVRLKHLHIPATVKETVQRNIQCDHDPHQFVGQIPYKDLKEKVRQEFIMNVESGNV